mgnify:FL=1
MDTIGIIFAMNEELTALKKYFTIDKITKIYDLTFYEVDFIETRLVLVESGVGKVNAGRTTQILIDNYKPSAIYNIGVAGGVDKSLKVGDVVISTSLVQHDFDITAFDHKKGYIPNVGDVIPVDRILVMNSIEALEKKSLSYKLGCIASGDIFCTDAKMASKINKKFNALCVEMEGAAIGQACFLCQVPCLVLRSISDCPDNNNRITYDEFLPAACENIAQIMYTILTYKIKEL